MPKPKEEYDDEQWYQPELPLEYSNDQNIYYSMDMEKVRTSSGTMSVARGVGVTVTDPNVSWTGVPVQTHKDWTKVPAVTKEDLTALKQEILAGTAEQGESMFQQIMDRLDQLEERLG
jgi:hypothetical protein